MLTKENAYDQEMLKNLTLEEITKEEITESLEKYITEYEDSFKNKSQRLYFSTYEKGLLSDLERKTIEPVALALLNEKDVRGFQHFFQRSNFSEKKVLDTYQTLLSQAIGAENGFLSVDGSDFPKKGIHSAGVARQYCGRLGKTENCQAGVFISYASEKGYGLIDRQLYMPESWFSEEKSEFRKKCKVPENLTFHTKNEIALEQIRRTVKDGKFPVKWVGCDAAFGSDCKFLSGLPDSVCYFAAVKKNKQIFLRRPDMLIPEPKRGKQSKYLRPSVPAVSVSAIADSSEFSWEKRTIALGTKGPVQAEIKCIRCVSTDNSEGYLAPADDIWLYIRKYQDGTIKYFISNAPADTSKSTLDMLSTMRWSIEQCFEECKSFLGMTHYETRTYRGWHCHMLFVMIAHLFTTILRQLFLKKFA